MSVLKTLLVLLLASMVVPDHHNQCGDSLMESLQQCAAAIKNNEPLSVQQEKCSPNGCNYDCPSTDVLNTLNQQVSTMNITISYVMDQQKETQKQFANVYGALQNTTATLNASLYALSTALGGTSNNLTQAINQIIKSVASNKEDIQELSNTVDEYHGYCGSNDWTLVSSLNMSDPSTNCPSPFSLYVSGDIRACRRQFNSGGSCDSFKISVDDSYSQVCGRFRGHVFGTPDAVHQEPHEGDTHDDINSYYVDGISLTYGSPRTHIWTFMAGYEEGGTHTNSCPCNQNNYGSVQSFIGNDYYCESGIDVLWDGECSPNEIVCCQPTSLPYFHKILNSETSADLEIRICGDQSTGSEDVPISFYELFVK